jgi:hypothetical protein
MTGTNRAYTKERSSLIQSKTYQSKMNYDKEYFSLITSKSELAELEKAEEELNRAEQYFELVPPTYMGLKPLKKFPKQRRSQISNSQKELLKEKIDLSEPLFEMNVKFTPTYNNYSTDLY